MQRLLQGRCSSRGRTSGSVTSGHVVTFDPGHRNSNMFLSSCSGPTAERSPPTNYLARPLLHTPRSGVAVSDLATMKNKLCLLA
ncbi:unnamed protein product [Amoebophrya sp. A120]|nr:unnamed protein product [Amoebophrya sp. A120]|eukprot:GSA120T00019901001.1